MEKKAKPRKCKVCETVFVPKQFMQPTCSYNCLLIHKSREAENSERKKKTPIKKVSDKRKIENLQYAANRIVFLNRPENRTCPITGTPTTDIHHKKGRTGSLFLDETYWVALSREGHRHVEENPEWAKENGYSLSRLSK